jgi:hypothetical protein
VKGRAADACLSERDVRVLAQSAPGRAPAELAAHVARCARCQERMLRGMEPVGPLRPRREPPPLWRTLLLLGGVILVLVSLLWVVRFLGGP